MKKRVLSLLLVLMMVLSLVPISALAWPGSDTDIAYAVTGGNIYFDRSTGTITGCDSEVTEANIPSEIDGVPVTNIGDGAFFWCKALTRATIPNSVTNIGSGAFYNCEALTSINLSNSLTSIGFQAFMDCTSLTEINIPNSVNDIASMAFYDCSSLSNVMLGEGVKNIGGDGGVIDGSVFEYCTSLESINVPETNPVYSSDNGVLFNKDKTVLIKYPAEKTDESYTIPNGVTDIDRAFSGAEKLKNVTIPTSMTAIDYCAFESCTALENINIPESIVRIGGSDDGYVDGPSGADTVFSNCISLKNVNVAESNTAYTSVDGILFSKDIKTLIKYPAGRTDASYVIPDSVTNIGDCAFAACTSLESVDIPNSITRIGGSDDENVDTQTTPQYVFSGCSGLKEINVAEGNPAYLSDSGILFNKEKTTILIYPAGKTDSSYIISNSVTSIEHGAFSGCTSIASVEIPNSVTSIKYGAFSGCTSLASVEIPNSVTSVEGDAFSGCTGLTSVTIPDGITNIDYCTFTGCTSLADVYYTGSAEQWSAMEIGDLGNEALLNATIHYNYHEHVTELRNAVEPTCTDSGYTGDEVCTICGEVISQGEVIDATGHHFKGNTCPDCGATRSTGDTIRAWFQDSFNNFKSFFDKLFGR